MMSGKLNKGRVTAFVWIIVGIGLGFAGYNLSNTGVVVCAAVIGFIGAVQLWIES